MIKTKSKFAPMKIRNASKKDKDAVKAFSLCDSDSGYLFMFFIYDGKNNYPVQDLSKTANVVASLVQSLPYKGINIYMDNYYSTTSLFRRLHDMGHNAIIGTTRANRVPNCLQMRKSVPRGSIIWRATA